MVEQISKFLACLDGGLWHTTSPDRARGIIASNAIMVEPRIDDRDRWNAASGPQHFPIARTIGGVSLFDFQRFDPDSYSARYPLSSWRIFIPYQRRWHGAVWFKIDRNAVGDRLISAEALLKKWKDEKLHSHNILPAFEAAHIGDIPISAINSAFLTWNEGREVRDFDVQNYDNAYFETIISEWRGNEMI